VALGRATRAAERIAPVPGDEGILRARQRSSAICRLAYWPAGVYHTGMSNHEIVRLTALSHGAG
jgi:hypothetical protein